MVQSHSPPRRTLVVGPSAIDEAVLAQPLLAALRRQDPRGRIDCLAPAASAALFRAMSDVDEVVEAPVADHQLGIGARLRLARRLALRRYDVAWVLPLTRTAAIAPWLAGIPVHAGRDRPSLRRGDGGRRVPGSRVLLARWFATLPYASRGLPPPDPAFTDRPAVLDRPPALSDGLRHRLQISDGKPLFLLCPGSPYGVASRWPARHFAALTQLIHGRWPQARIAAIGTAHDRDLGKHLQLLAGGRIEDWTGLALDQSMELMSAAEAVVGNDSPLLLLAAAMRRPHVTLYGAGDPRAEPVEDARREVIWLRQPCSPCLDSDCRFGHTDCLVGISPAAVMAALRRTSRFSSAA